MRFPFETILCGHLNGEAIEVIGAGFIDEDDGVTNGDYELRTLPTGFPVEIIPVLKITGYPNASKPVGGATNPFKGLSYQYRRVITFDTAEMVLTSKVFRSSTGLKSSFEVKGHFSGFGNFGKLSVIHEQWIARGGGRISGAFHASWRNASDHEVKALARTEYKLGGDVTPIEPHRREIFLETRRNGKIYSVIQNVILKLAA